MRTAVLLVIVALTGAAARADILHLRDGTRHSGTLISHTKDEIVFRVRIDAGGSTVVRRYAPADVARIERDQGEPIAIPAIASAPPADDSPPRAAGEPPPPDDVEARAHDRIPEGVSEPDGSGAPRASDAWNSVATAAFEALRRDDVARALRDFQRIALRGPREARALVEDRLKLERDADLAGTLAELRVRAALVHGRGRSLRIDFATELEKPALARLLEHRADELLNQRFGGHALRDWAHDPGAYERLTPDAQAMVAAARVAGGLLHARLRFDPRFRDDRAERLRLRRLADALARFAATVARMTGFTSLQEPPELPPTSAAARPPHAPATAPAAPPAPEPPGGD